MTFGMIFSSHLRKIMSNNKETQKQVYITPQIESEEILEAGLMATCNGTTGGPDNMKAAAADGCSTKKT